MIIEKDVNSWEELQTEVNDLFESLGDRADDLLFRGQSDASWQLDTTAERKLKTPIDLNHYYCFAYSAKSKLETFVDKPWDIPMPFEYEKWLKNKDSHSFTSVLLTFTKMSPASHLPVVQ